MNNITTLLIWIGCILTVGIVAARTILKKRGTIRRRQGITQALREKDLPSQLRSILSNEKRHGNELHWVDYDGYTLAVWLKRPFSGNYRGQRLPVGITCEDCRDDEGREFEWLGSKKLRSYLVAPKKESAD
jgi:hypothetical protein